ncbi:hypothetical protein Pint_17968 [Pistacia integerrima]|uniref:Uncharacterized protein n=1 Tax=Pistacia integerrima TaxID=434235 RepID=A0ACC0Z1E8_9ROSI|nr:hypothetical protein Pint_17968 [Pistacia integerrima]
MDMKKICCAVLVATATISCILATTPVTDGVATGGVATSSPSMAPGPGPASSGAAQTLQVLGSFVGTSLLSFLTYFLRY